MVKQAFIFAVTALVPLFVALDVFVGRKNEIREIFAGVWLLASVDLGGHETA